MSTDYLHGVEVVEVKDGTRPITSVRSSVIGLVGTAPDAAAAAAATLTTGTVAADNGLVWTAAATGAPGNGISIYRYAPPTANAALAVSVSGLNVRVSLKTGSTAGVSTSTAAEVLAAVTAVDAAAALLSVDDLGESDGSGVVDGAPRWELLTGGADAAAPLDTPVLLLTRTDAARLGSTGTLPAALDAIWDQVGAWVVIVRVAEGLDAAATKTNVIGAGSTNTGVHALTIAESVVHVTPRILIAPGFTAEAAVLSEMIGIAERLRAVIVADGPNSTDAAAITYREQWGSDRVYLVDPKVRYWDTAANAEAVQEASARVAGVIAKSDQERGFWWSPSNRPINGIIGTARAISFAISDPLSSANYLNENEVTTIVRQDGYRVWGNKSCSADPKWSFLSVRRTADMIHESLIQAHLWAVDLNLMRTYFEDVQGGVNAYLEHLIKLGAILGGHCWVDGDLNTPDQIKQGHAWFDFDFTPPYPAERITFRSHMVDDYLTSILPTA